MGRGRKRKYNPDIPGHIDQGALPRGIYWGDGRWYVLEPHPEGIGQKKHTVANRRARLSDLHAAMESRSTTAQAGTLQHLVSAFKASSEYRELATKTRTGYDWLADTACDYVLKDGRKLGSVATAQLSVPAVQRIVEAIALGRPAQGKQEELKPAPSKANRLAQFLRRLFAWGMRHGVCAANPVIGIRKVKERGEHRMPDHDAFAAVLAFTRQCATKDAHTAGSCPPYLPAAMVLAYNVRLRGIEVNTLTDAQILPNGIHSNRRKGSRDNVTTWTDELRQAVQWLQDYRRERMQEHGRPTPLHAKDRRLLVTETGTPLSKSALDSAWQRMIKRAITAGVISEGQRFAMHGLKHRGITDSDDKASGGHVTEAMRQLYDHEVAVVEPPKRR
ncbi:integrase [Stenotrophomonas sp.]|uniref:site-specific integrase n=1 Tax=Stenotrophomonas sp. TaxID=69392 RepID=UPI0028AB4ADB|nr:integrase [Stenotrophomonas sp.]